MGGISGRLAAFTRTSDGIATRMGALQSDFLVGASDRSQKPETTFGSDASVMKGGHGRPSQALPMKEGQSPSFKHPPMGKGDGSSSLSPNSFPSPGKASGFRSDRISYREFSLKPVLSINFGRNVERGRLK
jgi:hypothetical protein